MDNLIFSSYLILRIPAKKAADYLQSPQGFLNDQLFRAALYLASPGFYQRIASLDFSETALNKKEKASLLKYINRICFRPTPFGLFSSVTLVNWGSENHPRVNSADPETKVSPDELFTANFSAGVLQGTPDLTSIYWPNPTIYRAGEEYRFIRTGLDDSTRIREYKLQSIAYSKILKDLLHYCSKNRPAVKIIETICGYAGCAPEEAKDYFDFLKESQLLLSELQPNINGEDYLERLLEHAGAVPVQTREDLSMLLKQMKQPRATADYFKALSSGLHRLIPPKAGFDTESLLNVISHNSERGSLSDPYKDLLSDGLYALSVLCPHQSPSALKDFIKEFNTYFEGQRIPLLKVIDPETGIGYQQPVNEPDNVLLETLQIEQKVNRPTIVEWSAAHSYLLQAWHRATENARLVIELQDDDLRQLKKGSPTPPSLGMSVLFRIAGERVFIESAGGNNAVALMGRFTLADPAIQGAAREIASTLEKANNEVIFAEILHLSDPHIDNVNRRGQIWSWELPVTAAAVTSGALQLDLADLFVTVEQGMVVLRSEKHGKVVVPRLSSAYNHSLNKLPLFRFLADLPYQYGQYSLTLDLRQYFPGQSFYPRVSYKQAIIYPATWILNELELDTCHTAKDNDQPQLFRALARRLRLPEQFVLSEGDQQLVFDHRRDQDIHFFLSVTWKKKELVLKEFICDVTAKPDPALYIRQYNAFLYPTQPLRFEDGLRKGTSSLKDQRKFLPGSEWLYLKIYTPKAGISRLLLRLYPLLTKTYALGNVKKWFFIRYEDHATHLRLRLQVNPGDISQILKAFKEKLEKGVNEHVIREYQVDTYSRELERYRASTPDLTEDHFWASSEMVTRFLKTQSNHTATKVLPLAMTSVLGLINIFIPQPELQIAFSLDTYRRFSLEFKGEELKVDLDRQYRKLSPFFNSEMKDNQYFKKIGMAVQAGKFISSAIKLQASIASQHRESHTLLESIIHMHLNRLFIEDARKQEMIVYYFLYKYLRTEQGRKRSGKSSE